MIPINLFSVRQQVEQTQFLIIAKPVCHIFVGHPVANWIFPVNSAAAAQRNVKSGSAAILRMTRTHPPLFAKQY